MAAKDRSNGSSASKTKTFKRNSKMRRYTQIFDEDVQQMRCGYYDKTLYQYSEAIREDDIVWSITPGFEYRSDLISTKFYGTAKYDWIIEDLNNIADPIRDLVIGLKLKLPSQNRIITFG